MLKERNAHPRDSNIVFDEEPHVYYVHGDPNNISVTTLVHKYFPCFNPDEVISKMMRGRNWKNSKYFGMTPDEIKDFWKANGVDATTHGTHMHKSIESFYNGWTVEHGDTVEYKMFEKFFDAHPDLEAYRTEWEVYDETLKIAGSIDMVYKNLDDGTYSIYDWKRSKEIKMSNSFEKGFGVMENYPNCNYVHYSLQLNIYKYILETKYGLKIRDMFLIVMHPNNDSYLKYETLTLTEEVAAIFEERANSLTQQQAFVSDDENTD